MTDAPTAAQEWRRHWTLVLAACVGFSFTSMMTPAIGVFMAPLGDAFGWSRTLMTAGQAASAVLSLLFSPLVGLAIDRFGVRRLALPGLVLLAVCTSLFALLDGSTGQWLGLWLVWGTAALLCQSTLWSTALAGTFPAARGLALGVTLSGTAAAQVVVPPLATWLIAHAGWRVTFVAMGLGWGALAFVLSLLFLRVGQGAAKGRERTGEIAESAGLSIAEAWRDSSLWRIALATFLILSVTIAVTVHQIPIYQSAGLDAASAAWLASLSGVAGVIGKLVTGWLVDRFHARWVGGITLASTAVAYPLMMQGAASPALIAVACMISGYAAGTKIQLCGYLTARFAGMRNYGAVFGFMSSMIAFASAAGPMLGGAAFDRWGNYDAMLITGTILSLVTGALVFSLGRYPDWHANNRGEAG